MGSIRLSIIVPTYNRKLFLRRSILSLLREVPESSEIIVVDDGSTDGSLDTIADLSVIKVCSPRRQGQAAAQNRGLQAAIGNYIAFFDSDDLVAPLAMRWRVEWLDSHPNEYAVAGIIEELIDEHDNFLGSFREVFHFRYQAGTRLSLKFYRRGFDFPKGMVVYCFRRELIQNVGFFDERLRNAHDADFLFRILSKCEIPVVMRPVLKYRIHSNNSSHYFRSGIPVHHRQAFAEYLLVQAAHGITPRFP